MKLENLEKALQEHLAAGQGREHAPGAPPRSLEDARAAAYRYMTLTAWDHYLQCALEQAHADFMDEVVRAGVPKDVLAQLTRLPPSVHSGRE